MRVPSTVGGPAGPVLIGGLDRSGKTQLRLALELIPDLAWVRRVEPWTHHAGRLGDVRDPAVAERAIARLVTAERLAELAPDAARLREEVSSAVADAGSVAIAESRLLGLLLAHHAAASGRTRWGLQEAGIERHAPSILEAFPGARCVILVRDPRDRLAAVFADRARPGAAGPAAAVWLASVRRARRAEALHRGRVLLVRMEDLASRPTETLQTICGHLGATFDGAMLHPGGADPFGILAGSIGAFRTGLAPGQAALVEALAGRVMIELGYEPRSDPLAVADRIRYWFVEAPLGLGRLAVARARTAVTGRSA